MGVETQRQLFGAHLSSVNFGFWPVVARHDRTLGIAPSGRRPPSAGTETQSANLRTTSGLARSSGVADD